MYSIIDISRGRYIMFDVMYMGGSIISNATKIALFDVLVSPDTTNTLAHNILDVLRGAIATIIAGGIT